MKKTVTKRKTTVGDINADVLAYTAGKDVALDSALVEMDCLGSAAHAAMLERMKIAPPLLSPEDTKKIIAALVGIMREAAAGTFRITLEDQDVHLAVERKLTESLGDLGKKIHTGRSRNDQVAVDLRLYAKLQLLDVIEDAAGLATAFLEFAQKNISMPMVGRTHMQPAMPSSVGLWASAYAEGLLDDLALVRAAYDLNDRSPLGSAASYGVPLPIDRQLVSDLLGFSRPIHNVLHANNSRGKNEAVILSALGQVMLTLSRFAQDLMIFTMPEFAYFSLPAEFCTGSSIMPQKKNPDVLELVRAKATKVHACAIAVHDLVRSLPSGYNRDLQEAKEYFLDGIAITRDTLQILASLVSGMAANEKALRAAFTSEVFATDRALELVGQGMPFRDAYHHVKEHLDELKKTDPSAAIARKTHLGATAGLDLNSLWKMADAHKAFANDARSRFYSAMTKLLGVAYPL